MNQILNKRMLLTLVGVACFLTTLIAEEAQTAAEYSKTKWVNVPTQPPEGVQHETFHSKCMDTEVGYNIYLPPGYKTDSDQRFPVLYLLHGGGSPKTKGHESRLIHLTRYLHSAILKEQVPQMIMVFANGGRGVGHYFDSLDGTLMPETMIIKELIPHIDAHFRTINDCSGRAIQGWSMGGGGALQFAAKYPDLFSSVVALAYTGMFDIDRYPNFEGVGDKEEFRRGLQLFEAYWGDDKENSIWYLLEKNRDRIVNRLAFWIIIGTEDNTRIEPGWGDNIKQAHDRFLDLKIAYEFKLIQGAGHNPDHIYDHCGVDILRFHARHFGASRD